MPRSQRLVLGAGMLIAVAAALPGCTRGTTTVHVLPACTGSEVEAVLGQSTLNRDTSTFVDTIKIVNGSRSACTVSGTSAVGYQNGRYLLRAPGLHVAAGSGKHELVTLAPGAIAEMRMVIGPCGRNALSWRGSSVFLTLPGDATWVGLHERQLAGPPASGQSTSSIADAWELFCGPVTVSPWQTARS